MFWFHDGDYRIHETVSIYSDFFSKLLNRRKTTSQNNCVNDAIGKSSTWSKCGGSDFFVCFPSCCVCLYPSSFLSKSRKSQDTAVEGACSSPIWVKAWLPTQWCHERAIQPFSASATSSDKEEKNNNVSQQIVQRTKTWCIGCTKLGTSEKLNKPEI